MEGWIKIHRKIEARERYTDANTFRVFFHLLINANHKGGRWQGIDVKRGQTVIGRKSLAEKLKLSEQQVRRAIFNLQNTGEITSNSTNKFTIVTLVNYGLYNDMAEENNQQNNQQTTSKTTNKQPQTRIIRNKEGKEDIQFNEHEKEIIKTYELGFDKLDDTQYRHKLDLLIQLLITSGQVSFTNGGLASYTDEKGKVMNKIERIQVVDYKVAKIKAIEVVSAKDRYKVKDFWATLNNRIKKDLSAKSN